MVGIKAVVLGVAGQADQQSNEFVRIDFRARKARASLETRPLIALSGCTEAVRLGDSGTEGTEIWL